MSLDIVEVGLSQAGIKYLRFDGKVPQKERKGILDKYRQDSTCQVLLLTLSCGAVGQVYSYCIIILFSPRLEPLDHDYLRKMLTHVS